MSAPTPEASNPSPSPDPMRRRRARTWALAAVMATGALAMTYGWPSDAADPEPKDRPTGAKLVVSGEVAPARASRSRTFAGTLEAQRHAALSFTIPGRVVERRVDIGDHVEAGEILAVLDKRPLRHQLASARATRSELEARTAQADRDDARMRALVRSASIAEAQAERTHASLDALRANEQSAQTGVAEARRLLGEAVLVAPFSGTVTAAELEAGEYANPGVPVIELTGDGALELLVEVPETVVVTLTEGQTVDVSFPLIGDRKTSGTVRAPAQGARGRARLFPVRIEIEKAPDLLPGMTAEVHIETPVRAEKSVAVDAVINPGGERPSVFVVRAGKVERVPVEVVDVVDGRAFITGDIADGEAVVTGGHAGLATGVEVEVAP